MPLQNFTPILCETPTKHVIFACHKSAPPPLAFAVHFPILTLPVTGIYELEIELNGEPTTIQIKPGTAIFSPPNCWTNPTWKRDCKVTHLLFGKTHTGISCVTVEGERKKSLKTEKASIRRPISGPSQSVLNAILEMAELDPKSPACPHLIDALSH